MAAPAYFSATTRPVRPHRPKCLALAYVAGAARVRACAPHVDGGEQEQPDHVDEVPVPGSRLEAEVGFRGEGALQRADEADEQEDRADQHVRAVEARRHEE